MQLFSLLPAPPGHLGLALALVAVVLLGALPPLYRSWSERGLHRLVSLAAGIFLGSLFLHLLPELAGGGHAHGPADHDAGGEGAGLVPWGALLFGFLFLFVVERVWLVERDGPERSDPHRLLFSATFVGLCVHSFSTGLGISAFADLLDAEWAFYFGLCVHKGAEAFSLSSVMRLAGLGRRRALGFLGLFALATPLGMGSGRLIAGAGDVVEALLTGFACGTFLYVSICDLLPEVFHERREKWTKLAWVVAGVLFTGVTLPQADGVRSFALEGVEGAAAVFISMAPYLLLGLVVAGALRQWMKPEWLERHLARNDARSVIKAALIGAPLPLCSCSVLPVAISLRKAGASRGATSAFLIATPETGVDSVSVTWALLDPIMTVVRPIGAVLTAILTGGAVSLFASGAAQDDPQPDAGPQQRGAPSGAACCSVEVEESCHPSGSEASGAPGAPEAAAPRRGFLRETLRFAFVDMLDDLAGLLLVGMLVSGLISAAIPASFFELPVAQGFSGLLLMLVVGIPIYVCAAASTPIAASLVLKGLSPGAALVFLLASPATNAASLVAVSRTLGRRALLIHVGMLAATTLALGWFVDRLYPWLGVLPSASLAGEHSMLPAWLVNGSALVFGVAVVASVLRTRFGVGASSAALNAGDHDHDHDHDPAHAHDHAHGPAASTRG